MRSARIYCAVTLWVLLLFAPATHAESHGDDVYWHIDPSVESCSMVIDSSLTQGQWHDFVTEASAIVSFKSLAPARTQGKGNFYLAIDDGYTPVDQHSLAWINTFTHPDADCPLGDVITVPTIRASIGVSDRVDLGGYWTTAPGANYGAVGGAVKYAFLQKAPDDLTAAVRASFSLLTGVPDFNLNIYSIEVMASKRIAVLVPYAGLRENFVFGTETTSKVDLQRERLALTQGYAGAVCYIWKFSVAAEYNVASVNTLALAVGVHL